MSSVAGGARRCKGWVACLAACLLCGPAILIGAAGCGDAAETSIGVADRDSGVTQSTVAAAATTTVWNEEEYNGDEAAPAVDPEWTGQTIAGTLIAAASTSGQKIISDAQLEIEVETGEFQTVFDQALVIADRYGGYLVSSTSYASGEEDSMRSGTVVIRIPSGDFVQALRDADSLGMLKNQSLSTQDVTEEYVDLEARIKNSEAYVQSMIALLDKAGTVEEILQVQSVLAGAQQDLEALKGRMRYLEEHTSFSTITMTVYETGVESLPSSDWGVTAALKDGLHNLVKAFNAIIRGLGVLVPVLIVLAVIAYIVYRVWRTAARRNQERRQLYRQPYPQTWSGQPGVQPDAPGHPQTGAQSFSQMSTQPVSQPGLQTAAQDEQEQQN